MPLIARRRIVASAAALVATLALAGGMATTPSASADQPPAPVRSKADISAQADTSLKCAKAAKKQATKNKKKKYWTCVGTKARYFAKHKAPPSPAAPPVNKQPDGTFTGVGVDPIENPITKASETTDIQAKDIFQDDGRCETVPDCINIKTLYRANGKWNGFYGYGDEVWGRFDIVWDQYFNGASSNYNLELIWDRGYEIDTRYYLAQVRWNRPNPIPDPVTGSRYMYPSRISAYAIAAIYPSQGNYLSTEPTTHKGKHHDDLYGTFIANGYTFYTGTVHLPDFHCPNNRCKYYGPTGPV